MRDEGTARQALTDALNGEVGQLDMSVVRGLRSLATSVDGLDSKVGEIEERLKTISNRIIVMSLSVTGSVIATILGYVIVRR